MSGGQGIAAGGVGAVAEITFRVLKSKEGVSFRSRRKLDETVGDFKQRFSAKFEVPADHVLFIFKGGIMTDERTFQNYGIKEGDTIDVVKCVDAASFVNHHSKEEMAEDLGGAWYGYGRGQWEWRGIHSHSTCLVQVK